MKTYAFQMKRNNRPAIQTSIQVLLGVLLFCGTPNSSRSTDKSGPIVNQTWTTNGSPYRIVGDILVAGLTIRPGVTVVFASNYVFEVGGKLHALGTPDAPILFASTNGGWGGIFFNNAPAGSELRQCVIVGAANSGVRLSASAAPAITGCRFAGNSTADPNGGGAISAPGQAGDLVIDECVFETNSAAYNGGAIRAAMTSGKLRVVNGCQFNGNVANPSAAGGDHVGGAIYVTGDADILDSFFTNNTSVSLCSSSFGCDVTGRGGALFLEGGTVAVKNSQFVGNTSRAINGGDCFFGGHSRAWGAAVYVNDGALNMLNSIMSYNITDASSCGPSRAGGALFVNSGSCSLVNVTCAYNTANSTESGIHVASGTTGITNSIVYFNATGTQISGTATVFNSDVQNGAVTNGNKAVNPLFLSASDLIIVPGSACVDGGSTNAGYRDTLFPPSLGLVRNDMGAHGGPGAGPKLSIQRWPQVEVRCLGGIPATWFAAQGLPATYQIQSSTNFQDWQTEKQFQIAHLGDSTNFVDLLTNSPPVKFYRLTMAP